MELFLMPVLAAISVGFLTAIAKAALGLGFVIFVHELGHFLVAKACGVKCEKFYVGFDVPIRIGPLKLPRTLFKKQWGETEYGIGIVPLGGYVKMLGQDDNPANSAREAERIRVARQQGEVGDEQDSPEIDPRSYPAKTVGQRLSIISAGVIMNLIFAVIFSMVAYRMGVSYTPTIVGATTPGLSAWEVGLETGDRILQLGNDGRVSEHLRFDKDMMVTVMMTGPHEKLDLLVERYTPPGEQAPPPETVTVQLSKPQEQYHGRPIIGIGQYGRNVIGGNAELARLLGHLPAYHADPGLEPGDRIVAVNGTPVADYRQLNEQRVRQADQPLELSIRRDEQSLRVTIPTSPVRHFGLQLEMGPISSIQQGSIAERAGLQVGDQLIAIDGQPVGDPMRLPDKIRRLAGQPIELQVQRGEQTIELEVTPQRPKMMFASTGSNRPIAVGGLGFAYRVLNTVDRVQEGSPAQRAGIQPGDVLYTAEFIPASEEDAAIERELYGPPQPIQLGKIADWPRVHERIRTGLPDTRLKLTYGRESRAKTAEMTPVEADNWYYADRGMPLVTAEEVHRVQSWSTALGLGWRETVESMRQVYFILYRLVTRQLSPMNLGGPASIATMAGMEASESTARLLMFLTLLSANLAVINFLPIPVLDGGHAMFLLYEGIFRKPMPERVALGLTMVGFCFVLGLMLFVIGLDIWRFTGMGS